MLLKSSPQSALEGLSAEFVFIPFVDTQEIGRPNGSVKERGVVDRFRALTSAENAAEREAGEPVGRSRT